jgi:hypothetical protein
MWGIIDGSGRIGEGEQFGGASDLSGTIIEEVDFSSTMQFALRWRQSIARYH